MCSTFVQHSVKVDVASKTMTDDRCSCNHVVDTMTSLVEPRDHTTDKHVTITVITVTVLMVMRGERWF